MMRSTPASMAAGARDSNECSREIECLAEETGGCAEHNVGRAPKRVVRDREWSRSWPVNGGTHRRVGAIIGGSAVDRERDRSGSGGRDRAAHACAVQAAQEAGGQH